MEKWNAIHWNDVVKTAKKLEINECAGNSRARMFAFELKDLILPYFNQSLMELPLMQALISNATRVLCVKLKRNKRIDSKRNEFIIKVTSYDLTRIRN